MAYTEKNVSLLQGHRDDPSFDGMDDATFLAAITVIDGSTTRLNQLTAKDIFEAVDSLDMPAVIADSGKSNIFGWVLTTASSNTITLDGNIQDALMIVFDPGAVTRSNLQALKDESISLIQEWGLPTPAIGDVERTI